MEKLHEKLKVVDKERKKRERRKQREQKKMKVCWRNYAARNVNNKGNIERRKSTVLE